MRVLLGAVVAGLLFAVPASANVTVFTQNSGSDLEVDSLGTMDTQGQQMRVIIEQFIDSTRNGVRVRQIGFGDPTISSGDSSCTTNPFFNDVVCTPFPSTIEVHALQADDHVIVGGSNVACAGTTGTHFVVNLNGGNDVLETSFACGGQTNAPGINALHPIFDVAYGGDGNDSLTGGRLNDHFEGDAGSDTLSGGAGNDFLDGGAGNDSLHGGDGDDTLIGGPGADVMDGGNGTDTASYAGLPGPVTVTLDGVANDGAFGEQDNLISIEHVIGSNGDDNITGSAANETIDGGPGNDTIVGGNGFDNLNGGAGDDLIDARDGFEDHVTCGLGKDQVIADLLDDVQPVEFVRTVGGIDPTAGCETVGRFAVDDGPPGHVAGRRVAIGASGSLTLTVACPRTAKVSCAGTLSVADPRHPSHPLAHTTYAIKLGRSSRIRLTLSRSAAAGLRGLGALTAQTRERGKSKKGPRSSSSLLLVSRR